ncbi:hypothetical protein D3C74_137650 [compost metagenome]
MPKVLKKFRDKLENHRIYEVGDNFNGERQDYLASLGFIKIEEKKQIKKPKKEEQAVE